MPSQPSSYSGAEFDNAQEIQRWQSPVDAEGKFKRIRLVKTDLKYPFVRVESTVMRNPVTRAETTLFAQSVVANQALVSFRQEVDRARVEQLASFVGAKVRKRLLGQNAYILETEQVDLDELPRLLRAIAAHTNIVVSVDPNGIGHAELTPNDPRFGEQWSLNNLGGSGSTADADIDAPEAWNINTGGSSVVVAVIDTGVDFTHPDLVEASWVNTGEVAGNGQDDDGNGLVDDRDGWDFVNDDNTPADDNYHGTHVAGILGARGNNGIGIAGVAWNCTIMALKVQPVTGKGGTESDLLDALNYARLNGAQIINLSVGGYPQSTIGRSTMNGLETAGILVVCAAGNDARDTDLNPNYPSCYTNLNIISVANSTDDDDIASSSNFGVNSVDLAAPGTRILSTMPPPLYVEIYQPDSGTSMASPHVAGVAALLKSANASWTATQLRTAILGNVDRLVAFNGVVATGGRLNAYRAIVPSAITLTSPNGGGIYQRGRSLHINWTTKNVVGQYVSLELLKSGVLNTIIMSSNYNSGFYTWVIPSEQVVGTDYQVRVTALPGGPWDESDSFFEITTNSSAPLRIEISTLEDLRRMTDNWNDAQRPRNGYYLLMADIDASATRTWNGGLGFKPIGNGANDWFRGTFDGQGHRITGLYCTRPDEAYAALFAVTMQTAVIKNLILEPAHFRGQGYRNRGGNAFGGVGGIVGENSGLIQNCQVSLAGFHMYVTNGSHCGGIVGANFQGTILSCSVVGSGDITARGTSGGDNIGGIAGMNSGVIRWCWVGADVAVDADIGGNPGDTVGGIVGWNTGGRILECESRARFIDGEHSIGGVAGRNDFGGEISDSCYRGGTTMGNEMVGGIAGRNEAGLLNRCYASGGISGSGARGALVGQNESLIGESYWNAEAHGFPVAGSGSGTVTNCFGRTVVQMMQKTTFTNWDFTSVWAINEGVDLPTLRGVGASLLAPPDVTASTGIPDGVHVTWAAAPEATHYLVFRSDEVDGPKEALSGQWLTGFVFVDTTATPLTTFYYWVRAGTTRDGGRGSPFSAPAIGSRALPPPRLGVARYEGNIVLTWPGQTAGFRLVSVTNLGSTNWSLVTPLPVIVDGLYTVTNSVAGSANFYRLSNP